VGKKENQGEVPKPSSKKTGFGGRTTTPKCCRIDECRTGEKNLVGGKTLYTQTGKQNWVRLQYHSMWFLGGKPIGNPRIESSSEGKLRGVKESELAGAKKALIFFVKTPTRVRGEGVYGGGSTAKTKGEIRPNLRKTAKTLLSGEVRRGRGKRGAFKGKSTV